MLQAVKDDEKETSVSASETIGSSNQVWKRVYWVVLVLLVTVLVYSRKAYIWPGDLAYLDQGLLVFFALLVLLPLVSEMEAFGVRIKRQIENVRDEIRRDIQQVQNVVANNVAGGATVNVAGALPSQAIIDELKQYIDRKDLPQDVRDTPVGAQTRGPDIPDKAVFLFAVRYALEQKLNDIRSLMRIDRASARQMFRLLQAEGYLSKEDEYVLSEVWKVTSSGIHGHPLEDHHLGYVQDAYPYALKVLDNFERAFLDDG